MATPDDLNTVPPMISELHCRLRWREARILEELLLEWRLIDARYTTHPVISISESECEIRNLLDYPLYGWLVIQRETAGRFKYILRPVDENGAPGEPGEVYLDRDKLDDELYSRDWTRR